MLECINCGARYNLDAERDLILNFRLMPDMFCLRSQCPTCGFIFTQFYGDNDELLLKHAKYLHVSIYSVPSEALIRGYRKLFNKLPMEPRELTKDDIKVVRKFRKELADTEYVGFVIDEWGSNE